jgi:hypothetical protein
MMTDTSKSREVSTIGFPYSDLEDAIKIIRTMHSVGGGVPMERDQVSAALNSSGGSLANRLSAAKQFGLLDSGQGKWSLTPLAYAMLDEQTERAAKAEAFLSVELYKRTYEEYRGKTLPGNLGLEHAFTTFGVTAKQKEKARQTFERSARTAGFFPNGSEDRLVQPVLGAPIKTPEPAPPADEADAPRQESFSAVAHRALGISKVAQPPSFMGWLLDELPEPKSEWPTEDQANWLQAVAQAFRVVYRAPEGGVITVSVGQK